MPVHLDSTELTGQARDAPWLIGALLTARHGLRLRRAWAWGAGLRDLAFQVSLPALHGQEGVEQHLEISGAAVQSHLSERSFRSAHHGDHQAEIADHALPLPLRCQAERCGQLLYGSWG